ncbi:hypothetical protein [Subtercola endophyticus]|uniref:hypothetical protein n=1 Tax=Subtercola endophyticus TaxID=2895559 RepID=UPI001E36CC99|nr:hypothetical protein [Subtercola endophyticus]UFS58711.1 hypothetical protein LQ955_17205 [Subtercola endophyticus]
MQRSDAVLFSAAHGFYNFAVSRNTFDRSLYYNLLLQPALAIPDHYFLQKSWVGAHLTEYRSRDSWIEVGLRGGFIQPYFRREGSSLTSLLSEMERTDRRGFDDAAEDIADRLDRTSFQPLHWSSGTNSKTFGSSLQRFLAYDEPPALEFQADPADFRGFWSRSREWISEELDSAAERSSGLLQGDGILLSQLIQVAGERLLGPDCGRISSVDALLTLVRERVGYQAAQDLRVYLTCACELYNRSLADTILTAPGSPRWSYYVAAMDLWLDDVSTIQEDIDQEDPESPHVFDVSIQLPHVQHLRNVSGDTLLAIRKTAACERYLESLAYWRSAPKNQTLQNELVETLHRYTMEIKKLVGKEVGAFALKPQFISNAIDVSRVFKKVPNVLQGFLAVSVPTTSAAAASGLASPYLPAGLATLFALQTIVKNRSPAQSVEIMLSDLDGARMYPDVTISRA